MEDRPEGTPNPLNPNMDDTPLDANPSEPMQPIETLRPVPPVASNRLVDPMRPVRPVDPMIPIRPAERTQPVEAKTVMTNTTKPETEPELKQEPTLTPEPELKQELTTRGPELEQEPKPRGPELEQEPKPGPESMQKPVMDANSVEATSGNSSSRPIRNIASSTPIANVTPPRPIEDVTPHGSDEIMNSFKHNPSNQTEPLATLGVVTNIDGTVDEMTDPSRRPMQRAVESTPVQPRKNKKRTAIIVGIIVSLVIAITCGIAAVVIALNNDKTDYVATAVNKILSGNASTNLMIDGEIDAKIYDTKSPVSDLKITLGTEMVTTSLINSTMATINANLRDGGSFSVTVSEVYAANGALFIRVDGAVAALEAMATSQGQNSSDLQGSFVALLNSFKDNDGVWIRIPTDDLNSALPDGVFNSGELACATDLVGDVTGGQNTVSNLYNKYPFIMSTDANVTIKSDKNTVRKIVIDESNFDTFMDKATEANVLKSLTSCLGYRSNAASADRIKSTIQDSVELYAEVDEFYNFTRLYLSAALDKGAANVIADFNFSYPENVNIPGPVEYKEWSEINNKSEAATGDASNNT